jgi:hypothetical protein
MGSCCVFLRAAVSSSCYWVDSTFLFRAGLQDRRNGSRKTFELLLENLLRERRNRLMISKSTIRGKRSTWKDQRDLRRGKRSSDGTKRRSDLASYLDTSRRGRDETATHRREKGGWKKENFGFQYLISFTCDNPLMSNRCLLNVSGFISNLQST